MSLESQNKFLNALKTGCSRSTAARSAGLSLAEVNQWCLEAAADESSEYVPFLEEIRRIEAQLELLCHATVIKQAQTNPRWATWYIGHKRRSYEPAPPEVLPAEVINLRPRHRQFVLAYVCGEHRGRPLAAYRAAGYVGKGGSPSACRLLAKKEIQAAVQALTEAIKNTLLTSDVMDATERRRIVAEIARDPEYPPRARLAAIRLDAELTNGFQSTIEQHEIIVDLVPYDD